MNASRIESPGGSQSGPLERNSNYCYSRQILLFSAIFLKNIAQSAENELLFLAIIATFRNFLCKLFRSFLEFQIFKYFRFRLLDMRGLVKKLWKQYILARGSWRKRKWFLKLFFLFLSIGKKFILSNNSYEEPPVLDRFLIPKILRHLDIYTHIRY